MLYLFESTHIVILAEKFIRELNISYQIVPVPVYISSNCGMAIEISEGNELAKKIFEENNIKYTCF
ncbi:MAG: DUF3343 domain-containing protein [Bacteroidia bacterium]|nr:DUF3343 domain-containing protein [Bacteroidia bacterium]